MCECEPKHRNTHAHTGAHTHLRTHMSATCPSYPVCYHGNKCTFHMGEAHTVTHACMHARTHKHTHTRARTHTHRNKLTSTSSASASFFRNSSIEFIMSLSARCFESSASRRRRCSSASICLFCIKDRISGEAHLSGDQHTYLCMLSCDVKLCTPDSLLRIKDHIWGKTHPSGHHLRDIGTCICVCSMHAFVMCCVLLIHSYASRTASQRRPIL